MLLLAWYIWPLINPYWAQDRCVFGEVSNEEYRALLARAKDLAAADFERLAQAAQQAEWKEAEWKEAERILVNQLAEILPPFSPTSLQLAAAHAVLRTNGAVFRYSQPARPVTSGPRFAESVSIVYVFNVITFGIVRPYMRWGVIVVKILASDIAQNPVKHLPAYQGVPTINILPPAYPGPVLPPAAFLDATCPQFAE